MASLRRRLTAAALYLALAPALGLAAPVLDIDFAEAPPGTTDPVI